MTRSSVNYLQTFLCDLLHIQINENTFTDSFFFFFIVSLCCLHFCLLDQFRNNQMHCEIVDRYFNVFFVEIQLNKENLKIVFKASAGSLVRNYEITSMTLVKAVAFIRDLSNFWIPKDLNYVN